jgi:branched-chain amino acid transport system substrate-binding protein
MKQLTRRSIIAAAPATLALGALARPARAASQYGPGVTDKEIKIGNTCFYSGPASSYGTIGRAMAAYYKMVNDMGGVNGRMIDFISYDDAYSPPKTVEMTRKLVEEDHVLLDAGPLGTPTNSAIWHYMNQKNVPQLFVSTGASKWNDPKGHSWTIGWQPNYHMEGMIYAAYVLKHLPGAKVAVLYQDDDFGKDYLRGVSDGLAKAGLKVALSASYETTDTTVDSQVIAMKSAGCNAFVNTAIPKFAAQAIKKAAEIEWKPMHVLSSIGQSVSAVLKPGGLENSKGTVSDFYLKDPTDPTWKNDAGYKWWVGFMDKYYPSGDKTDIFNVYGPSNAATVVQVLKQCGNDLTRANVMRQAANLHNFRVPMLLPGITINTSPTDFAPIKQVQMARFTGERWELFGPLLGGAVG